MRKLIFLIAFVCGFGLSAQSQDNFEDFNSWWSFTASKELNDNSGFSVNPQFRFDENSLLLKDAFLDLEYSLKVTSFLKVSAGLRTGAKRKKEYFEYRNRLKVDLAFSGKLEDFKIQFRTRLQSEIKGLDENKNYWRNKLKIGFKINKEIRPFCSVESFTHLNNKEGMLLDGGRYSLGSEYRIDKKKSLKIFYSRDVSYNVKAGENRNILGLGFDLEL